MNSAAVYSYQQAGETSAQERERLIIENLPQVRLIARRIHDRLPEGVSLDDLISVGIIGLIAAVDHFDPGHKVKLKTYAEYKIRGAILDSLRELDWAPRQKRKKSRQIEAAISSAEQRLQRTPGEDEIAEELGVGLDEYHKLLLEVRGLNIGNIQSAPGNEDGGDPLQCIPDDEEKLPCQILERSELERLLADAINKMPPTERTVLSLYYQEELTLREIAPLLHLHESRVSQLKSQAILRLRTYMQKRWPTRGV